MCNAGSCSADTAQSVILESLKTNAYWEFPDLAEAIYEDLKSRGIVQ